ECQPLGSVIFLESGNAEMSIRDSDADAQPPTGIGLFLLWPLNVTLFQLLALGFIYCCARYPLFGRPHSLPARSVSDFGAHLTALGELLESEKSVPSALGRLRHYREKIKRDASKEASAKP